ncbi:MAG: ABC transporter ATP-binding protein [Alphaproteobacteria bacterium RIFCSPHIGHO2_02_FULL_46_13]|nr:MAG: ABC transporter ATP-binding protein [Alphaproteobacteria bacterium RIFCSPHIGHO2_02_FULL_46_13]
MVKDKETKPKADKGKLTQRVKRYGQVSTAMAGLATKVAGEKVFGAKIDREKHAADLLMRLGNLKGPLMKVGQILATIPEALPPEYAEAFQQLQSNAPPMGWAFVRRRMRAELGADWESKFKSFGHEAAAAASLGQVHKATLPDGREVACKLQYPDMVSAISADLSQLKMMFSLYESFDKSIITKNIHDELKDRLYEELDYTLEAKRTALYGELLKDEEMVSVASVVPELSTARLLTSTWMDGAKIMSFRDEKVADRNTIAMNMFRAWYVPLYYYGIIHGDPHMGNYSVRKDLGINLLDFGCVRVFRGEFVEGVINLYRSIRDDDIDLAVHAFDTWGFKNLNKEQIETLLIWARFLYGPLLDDKKRVIGQTSQGVYGRETARKVHERLKEVGGGITIPREFVFMDRAALGLGSVFIHLQAEINWHRLFEDMIADFDVNALKNRQKTVLDQFGLI